MLFRMELGLSQGGRVDDIELDMVATKFEISAYQATIHASAEDLRQYHELGQVLTTKGGRIVFNGFPTGVQVCHAMVHGGPYLASMDARTTSVGTLAMYRFARPVCFQNFPDECLPAELRRQNPLKIWRMVDGELSKEPA